MTKNRYQELVSNYVNEVIELINDESFLADFSVIQANFQKALNNKIDDPELFAADFLSKWNRFVSSMNATKFPNTLAFREIFDIVKEIRKIAKPFRKQANFPTKLIVNYQSAIESFNNYCDTFRNAIISQTILTDKQYYNLAKEFHTELTSALGRTLLRSNVVDKDEILDQMINLAALIPKKISTLPKYLPHLTVIDDLTDLFNQYFKQYSHTSSPRQYSSPSQTYLSSPKRNSFSSPRSMSDYKMPPETYTTESISLDQLRRELSKTSRRIANYATQLRGDISHKLFEESQSLTSLANTDVYIDHDLEQQEFNKQIQSYKEMAKMINRADALKLDLDIDKLEGMNKYQLISLIEALLQNEKVPLELRVSKGSPDEFKELAEKYEESQRYCEQVEASIQKLNIELNQLKTENKRLRLEADSASNKKILRERIKEIDERRDEIASELRRGLINGQTMTKRGTRPAADLYRKEIADLKRERDEAVEQLGMQEEDSYRLKIELLEKQNRDLQNSLNEKVQRIQSLQADLSREYNQYASDPPFKRRFQ